jgi:RHH-type proline utilization regulon transcriptional repressor/proline dehydrogenase/delta 1-pyrroline-5-carboxylate dehydrogenase
MIFSTDPAMPDPRLKAVGEAYLADEAACVESLLDLATVPAETRDRIQATARRLVAAVRERSQTHGGLDAFLHQYDLSTQEGVVLMCLAEALLRIPDGDTADRLIRDKLGGADFQSHLGRSPHLFVNATTWGLMLTGRIIRLDRGMVDDVGSFLGRLTARMGEPAIRLATTEAMRILGHQFVMGRNIGEALRRAGRDRNRAYRYSFDMLGEAALSQETADRFYDSYLEGIEAIAAHSRADQPVFGAPGISIKLSALHPRFEYAKRERVLAELVPRLETLARRAREANVGVAVDTEESERLELTLDVFTALFSRAAFDGWEGLGFALQCYQKRALPVVDWLAQLARRHRRRIMIRLVKGAYWDAEIKHGQERGLDDYPVFTRKESTDVAYLACTRRVLDAGDAFYPQFATHNAHTAAAVLELAADRPFEFQRLHGMGTDLYEEIVGPHKLDVPCRVYAPVGDHEVLLPYLVRRLLENGSNTSFVNRIVDKDAPIDSIIADPVARVRAAQPKRHPRIPRPPELYGETRRNSGGVNLHDTLSLLPLAAAMRQAAAQPWHACPIVDGERLPGEARALANPADRREEIGRVESADDEAVERAVASAHRAAPAWSRRGGAERAALLERASDLLEQHRAELMAMVVREGGRCVPDALSELREAVDFLRYYAMQARLHFAAPQTLPGPTGERNTLGLHGRGVFACISPWNFPVAIFTGQIAAALAAGNAVIAKPANATPLVAARTVSLLHEAGIPVEVLHLLPGSGERIGASLSGDERVGGFAFTGSIETAQAINRALAARGGPIVPLIAETGGQNAMIVDSSALPEQVVIDVMHSAFNSAGQRCSALRVLFVQDDIADHVLNLLGGAMAELTVGDPSLLATDVGPVIDQGARSSLETHVERMRREAGFVCQARLTEACAHGTFVAPCVFEIDGIDRLEREVFGPVLHVVRYASRGLDAVIESINATRYGLTLGVHTRIEETARRVQSRVMAGNCYVNRNMVGAVVGVQPFGGEGLSGTGPKAGGPHYLYRFAVERTMTVNTAAVGGNTDLFELDDD